MSSPGTVPTTPARSRRVPPVRVAVVEAGSIPGMRVTDALARYARDTGLLATPVGIDTGHRPTPVADSGQAASAHIGQRTAAVDWRAADPATPAVLEALAGVDTVVWMAAPVDLQGALATRTAVRRDRMVRIAQTIATATAAAGASRLVVGTSATVYGARADNPLPLPEDAPLRAVRDVGVVGDLLAVEEVIDDARRVHPGLECTVVRPATVVGPGIDTVLTRHFEAPRLLTVKGARPAWQFCHIDDLAAAVVTVVTHGLGPVVTVGADGWLTQHEVEVLTGMRRVELTEAVALGTASRLHRVGILPAPASELTYAVYPWVVDSRTARAAGWRPAYDNTTCVGVLLESIKGRHALAGRRVNRKEAALGAASAAVALVGTAAALRRARRHG